MLLFTRSKIPNAILTISPPFDNNISVVKCFCFLLNMIVPYFLLFLQHNIVTFSQIYTKKRPATCNEVRGSQLETRGSQQLQKTLFLFAPVQNEISFETFWGHFLDIGALFPKIVNFLYVCQSVSWLTSSLIFDKYKDISSSG